MRLGLQDQIKTTSSLTLQANQFHGNHAGVAGGVLSGNDINTIRNTCPSNNTAVPMLTTDCGAPVWTSNTVGPTGYGPKMAFPPAHLNISLPSELTYVSNGNARIPITAYALDQQGILAMAHFNLGKACKSPALIRLPLCTHKHIWSSLLAASCTHLWHSQGCQHMLTPASCSKAEAHAATSAPGQQRVCLPNPASSHS